MKEHEKLGQKQVSKVTVHFVWGSLLKKTNSGWFQMNDSPQDVFIVFLT